MADKISPVKGRRHKGKTPKPTDAVALEIRRHQQVLKRLEAAIVTIKTEARAQIEQIDASALERIGKLNKRCHEKRVVLKALQDHRLAIAAAGVMKRSKKEAGL